jgi:hypothetical protein
MRSMPVNVLAIVLLSDIVVIVIAPFAVNMFKVIVVPPGPSDDALKEQLEQRSREAYFKQLNEAPPAKKH